MLAPLTLLLFAPTQIIDDPFEATVVYITPVDKGIKGEGTVYADPDNCAFLGVSDRSFVSSKRRGAKDASSFLEFRLTAIYKKHCGNPLGRIDISEARYIGAMKADIDTRQLSSNCALTLCKDEYSVSVRLTAGLSSLNGDVMLKVGAPHSSSFTISFPMKAYLAHRATVLR